MKKYKFHIGTKHLKELIEAKNTDAAAQSLEIWANLLNFLSTRRSTNDSIDVFKISRIKTEKTVDISIIFSIFENLKKNDKNILKSPITVCILKFLRTVGDLNLDEFQEAWWGFVNSMKI